jgi:predicted N-acyltransferase
MQPDQWPKYKYLLLEIWRSANEKVDEAIRRERELCRDQIFSSLHDSYMEEYQVRELKRLEDLTSVERKQIADDAYKNFKNFLATLGWEVGKIPKVEEMVARRSEQKIATMDDDVVSDESWPSTDG